jgi:hypothetical protein
VLIFLVTVVERRFRFGRARGLIGTFLCVPSRSSQKAIEKILTLPLEFYDENNPDALLDELLEGLKTILGVTQKSQGS